jgi:maleate cis-trans isomerase
MNETQIQMKSLKGWRAEVGMLAPWGKMYREWEVFAPEGIRFSHALLGLIHTTPEGLKEMANQIEIEAKKLNIGCKCDLICLGCTSGSFIGGPGYDQMLIERIEKASGSPATTTTTCVLELFKDMGIKKMVLVGPYTDLVFEEELKFFNSHGFNIIYIKGSGLGYVEQPDMFNYMMDPYSSYKLVKAGAKAVPDADCVFLTCMASPLLGIADMLEEEVGKPVISSPSATLYGILKKLGIPDPVVHYGEALRRPRLPHQIKKR